MRTAGPRAMGAWVVAPLFATIAACSPSDAPPARPPSPTNPTNAFAIERELTLVDAALISDGRPTPIPFVDSGVPLAQLK